MNYKHAILAVVLMLVLSMAACSSAAETITKNYSCDDISGQHAITGQASAAEGDTIEVTVCANPTTGYEWTVTDAGDATIVKLEGSVVYTAPEEGVMGASGTSKLTLTAVGSGTTSVKMVYSRSWETGDKDDTEMVIAVTVK